MFGLNSHSEEVEKTYSIGAHTADMCRKMPRADTREDWKPLCCVPVGVEEQLCRVWMRENYVPIPQGMLLIPGDTW